MSRKIVTNCDICEKEVNSEDKARVVRADVGTKIFRLGSTDIGIEDHDYENNERPADLCKKCICELLETMIENIRSEK